MPDYSVRQHPGYVPLHEVPYLMRLALILYQLHLVAWHFNHISDAFKEANRSRWMDYFCCSCVGYYGEQTCGCYAILTCEYYYLQADSCDETDLAGFLR